MPYEARTAMNTEPLPEVVPPVIRSEIKCPGGESAFKMIERGQKIIVTGAVTIDALGMATAASLVTWLANRVARDE